MSISPGRKPPLRDNPNYDPLLHPTHRSNMPFAMLQCAVAVRTTDDLHVGTHTRGRDLS